MTKTKGYKLPDVMPDGLRCFMVAIPDDDAFLYAFMGAYRFFGTWVAWEREDSHRGTIAAELWRSAIEWTEGNMCDLPDYTAIFESWPITDIAIRLDEISTKLGQIQAGMAESQTVSIYNDCCCGDTGTGTPPTWYDGGNSGTGGEPLDPPDDSWATQEEYEAYKCKAANRIADDFLKTLANMAGFSGMVGILGAVAAAALLNTSALSGMIVGLMAIGMTAVGAVVLLLGTFVAMVLGGEAVILLIGDVANGITKADIVCSLYDSVDTEQARGAIVAIVEDAIGEASLGDNATLITEFFSRLLTVIVPEKSLKVLFSYDEDTDLSTAGYDCANCGLTPLLISDNFDVDTLSPGVLWTPTRYSWQLDAAEGNARDIDSANLRLFNSNWVAWGAPNGMCQDMTIEFDYTKLEDTGGTRYFTIRVKRIDGATLEVATFPVAGMTIGQKYHASVAVNADVACTGLGGTYIISWNLSTSGSRLRISIDNVVVRGTVTPT